ncbi:Membrane-bound lytic murein transglycosylase B [Candidatus Rhodobacter oscarellae]|uniref:Membrane-bound lytic murein transglycosylase B n=1 Tax=Candidatus Rhodobacter oscarellae TaxID=1675527 RepID=A0A0J9H4G9_9RHOB|nr:lytic murein transglycosylase [Candidatus Rhodobacter lobularis]KMW60553.1 Membrane-bound lytic murein transglycosylase B [Candidatus Rhodobacter lobularis]
MAFGAGGEGKLYVECGGSFSGFVGKMKAVGKAQGYSDSVLNKFFGAAGYSDRVIKADRRQGIFKTNFIDFSRKLISQNRIDRGRSNSQKYDRIFTAIERDLGVPRGILLSFWAFETDYGSFQGDFNTLDALMTLSHDCRRPALFQPQVFAALELYSKGDFSTGVTGAWAGEIGMVQMLPKDILERGLDGDGDGEVNLKESPADALFSGANMLRGFGWQPGQPWLQEVVLPRELPWEDTGIASTKAISEWANLGVKPRAGSWEGANLTGSILIPMGRKGPAFMAYPNYQTLFEWNQSFVYVATAGYFATRLSGAQVYDAGSPDKSLSDGEMKALQKKLAARGHDVGKIDGILGAGTRGAVQKEQKRLGLPADAWPTRELLNRL